MSKRRFVVKLPLELVRESSVVVLNHLRIEKLHPLDFNKESREVFLDFQPEFALHAVSEPPVAVFGPEVVDGLKILDGD